MKKNALPLVASAALSAAFVSVDALHAQSSDDEAAALALADSALAAITREDHRALAALFIDGGTLVAMPTGGGQPRVTTKAQVLVNPMQGDFVERGWDGEVAVSGAVASVWLPYDFYRDGEWSHCGVDVFSLVRTDAGWRIASLAYTVEQPPACDRHPEGPPEGERWRAAPQGLGGESLSSLSENGSGRASSTQLPARAVSV